MPFAERIYGIRKKLKLSQEKFGELAGVSQRTVAFWESGERLPSHAVLADLSAKLSVSVDYLLGLSDDPRLSCPPVQDGESIKKEPAAISDDELREATIARLRDLPLPALECLLAFLDALSSYQGSDSGAGAPPGSSGQLPPR